MKVSELKEIVNSTMIEFILSLFMVLIFIILNFMLISIFPNWSNYISLTLTAIMLAIYYMFARSSLSYMIKISKLLNFFKINILKLLKKSGVI